MGGRELPLRMSGAYVSHHQGRKKEQRLTSRSERANWPIQNHWNRIITLAAAWGGNSLIADQKWTNSTKAWNAISRGLDYWFENDYKPAECMGNGGNA